MPSTIKIRVQEAHGLPIMDRKTGLTDAYVEVRFGEWTDKTSVARLTLNPKWGEDFRIDVTDDNLLQDYPVEFK
jgi:Ca2+-dependent lipid-binding protein